MVVSRLALLSHSKQVLGLNLLDGQGPFCVEFGCCPPTIQRLVAYGNCLL